MQPDNRLDVVGEKADPHKGILCSALNSRANWVRVVVTADRVFGQGSRIPCDRDGEKQGQ